MGENPKQSAFFIQDPLTEEVQGPLTATQLRKWFALGLVDDWGVSKSPDGPWTPAARVQGLVAAVSARGSSSSGGESAAPTQTSGPASSSSSYKGDSDSWGKLVCDVFVAVAAKLRETDGQRAVGKFLRVGAALGLLGLVGIVGIGFLADLLADSGRGASGLSELRQKSGEADGVYRNRIANEVLVGVWRAEKDNSEPVVMPDGSSLKLQEEQLVFKAQPSQTKHGFFYTLADYDGGGIKPPESLAVVYGWEITSIKTPFFGNPVARVMYRPTEGPDFPEYQPGWASYDLAALRLKQARSVDRPVLEFVLKDKDTLIQKNAAGFEPPFIAFGDKVWHRVR